MESSDSSEPDESSIASLLELPVHQRDAAIRRFFINRKCRPKISNHPRIESYDPCQKSIKDFNNVFPLGRIFNKWKDGIPIFPKVKHSVGRLRESSSPNHDRVIQELLKGGIIETAPKKHCSFLSNFFLVPKDNGLGVRPIFDFSHLTRHLSSPHFVLPSLFQLIRRKPWPPNLFYIKFDFSAAFFNIKIKDSSKFVTSFIYNKTRFVLNRLPFGISIAPFVCQKFVNAIVRDIRQTTNHVWAHIDDILVAHHDPVVLGKLAELLIRKFTLVDWKLNMNKSVIKPSKNLVFLGAIWSQTQVKRAAEVTDRLRLLWQAIIYIKLKEKPLQRLRGLFNYYFQFAGNYHAFINKVLRLKDKSRYSKAVKYLLLQDAISFQVPPARKEIVIHSDASLYALGVHFVHTKQEFTIPSYAAIALNELKAAIIAIKIFKKLYNTNHFVPNLYIDNLNVLFLINKGTCKWAKIDPLFLFYTLKFFFTNKITVKYVSTSQNLADGPSRSKHTVFPW